jgi:small-conductance mechanosensitive channel
MDELKAKYLRQSAEYDTAVDSAIASGDMTQIKRIKELNAAMSKTLNAMIEKLTFLKKDSPSLKQERDGLVQNLRRIQQDYNGLLTNTDELETLRRIRQQASVEGDRQLNWYLFAFFLFACILLFYLVFYGKSEPTAMIASTVPTMPALT